MISEVCPITQIPEIQAMKENSALIFFYSLQKFGSL